MSVKRIAYTLVSLGMVLPLYLEVSTHGGWTWAALAAGLVGPDLALTVGAGDTAEHGHLPRSAVRPDNLLHRIWGPLLVLALSAVSPVMWAPVLYTAAFGWLLHVTVDRAAGFRLRSQNGAIRPESVVKPTAGGVVR